MCFASHIVFFCIIFKLLTILYLINKAFEPFWAYKQWQNSKFGEKVQKECEVYYAIGMTESAKANANAKKARNSIPDAALWS
jgi:hypothetical protein